MCVWETASLTLSGQVPILDKPAKCRTLTIWAWKFHDFDHNDVVRVSIKTRWHRIKRNDLLTMNFLRFVKSSKTDWAKFFEISTQIKEYICDWHEERISKLRNLKKKTNKKEQTCDHHLNAFSKNNVKEWRDLKNEDEMICMINCDK
jgi:hypothetical protein